jgi:hypothetical protein
VVAAGVEECRVRVDWSGSGVTYPAVLDPVWTATGSLSDSRGNVAFGTLTSGRFLIAGGRTCLNGTCIILSSAELYDPATETWAKIGDVSVPRDRFEAVPVPGKGLYLFGGDAGPVSTAAAEYYDEGTGVWKVLPSMATARANPVAKLLPDGKTIVVMGGVEVNTNKSLTSVEMFDTATEQWSSGGAIAQPRFWATGNLLPDGKILLAGGTTCDNCGPMKPAEIYDPVSQTSEVLPEMKTARLGHGSALTTINGAQVLLVFGGGTSTAEYFDFAQKTWVSVGNMAENRAFFAHVLRPDGSIIVAGGGNIPFFTAIKNVERFDTKTLTWSKAAAMSLTRALMGYTQLPDGKILVAAGVSGSILNNGNTSSSAELFQPGPQGDTCQGGGDCLSGFCVDGVCCDKGCGGVCEACSAAKKGSGVDGVCGPVAADTDPDDECPTQDKSTCGTSGTCDGKGACARYPAKTPCGAAQCVDGLSTGLLCSADGKCEQDVVSCAPFRCASKEACASACATDLECVPSAHCEGKDCKPDLAQGEACSRGAQCQSGFCVDGVCCATSCEGTCQACASALKQDGGPDGVCAPALLDTDPHEDCATDPVASCDRNGSCDGKGACALFAAGTACQEPTCAVDEKGVRVDQFACDGSGTCQATSSASCGFFGCQQGSCKTSCKGDSDCAPRAYCDEGQCVARKALGAICQEGRECLEGFCVDGFCCNSACDGQCEACDVTKALGLCVPVSGAPHNARSACAAGPAGQPCQQRTCDGIDRKSCAGYVGIAVACKEPSCVEGTANPGGLCDGKGGCSEPEPVRCEPFVCSGNACAVSCKSDADCSEKFRCDAAKGDCVPRTGASCKDASTLMNPDGTTTDCAPYACEGSSCKTQCSSVKDCALPSVCDDATRSCILAQPNPTDEAGCSAAPGRQGPSAALLLLALALLRLRAARRLVSPRGSLR